MSGCCVLLLCNLPLRLLWLVPDESALVGHGMSLDKIFSALLLLGVAAIVTTVTVVAVLRKRHYGSGFLHALWQNTCFKLFCFLDVPLLSLVLPNLVSR